jgi:hypothetical protein
LRGYNSSKITLGASKVLLRKRIHFHSFKGAKFYKQISDLKTFLRRSINQSDQLRILATVGSTFKNNFLKQKEKAIHGFKKFVHNLSEHVLTESEGSVLKRGLNFPVTNRVSNLNILCAAESARLKLPLALGMEFYWRIRCMLEESRPLTSNMNRKESVALESLKDNKEIKIYKLTKKTAR